MTLEQIKAAADSIFLDGVNQIVNHGYSYSKADAGEDMLAFMRRQISITRIRGGNIIR